MKKVVDMADRRPYSKATLADLGRSGLYEKDARKMRLVELTREDVKELTKGRFRCTGYKIPYFVRAPVHDGRDSGVMADTIPVA